MLNLYLWTREELRKDTVKLVTDILEKKVDNVFSEQSKKDHPILYSMAILGIMNQIRTPSLSPEEVEEFIIGRMNFKGKKGVLEDYHCICMDLLIYEYIQCNLDTLDLKKISIYLDGKKVRINGENIKVMLKITSRDYYDMCMDK